MTDSRDEKPSTENDDGDQKQPDDGDHHLEGMRANMSGVVREGCPHPAESEARRYWLKGWDLYEALGENEK